MEPNTTSLNLLTRDGGVCITFRALLSPKQYDEHFDSVNGAITRSHLESLAKELAIKWAIHVIADDC
jgi:hypothetical protein